MSKKIMVLSLLLCFVQYTRAQINQIDSLKQLILTEKQDTLRSLYLSGLGSHYIFSKPDTALVLAQEGLILAKQIGFAKGEAAGLTIIANVLSGTGNYPKALELHLDALKISENINNAKGMISILTNIGNIYSYQADYQKSLYYYYQALRIAESSPSLLQHSPLVNIGDAYEKLNQLDSARLFTQRGYDLSLARKDKVIANIALNNMGNIYAKMNEPIIAMEFYRSSLPYYEKENDYYGIPEATIGMAKLLKKEHKMDSALHYANRAMAAAKKGGFIEGILLASTFLADYYKGLNQYDSASFYFQQTIMAKDSLFSHEKNRQLQSLSVDEMLRQQDLAAKKAADAIDRQNNLEYATIVIGIICFAVLLILLSRSININEKWVEFLGVMGLLAVFEFINLFIHPYLADITNHSAGGMLLVMVAIAALLVPVHHRIERWVKNKMIVKNRAHRLSVAKKIVEKLEREAE